MQLSPTFRFALYATFWTLFLTGGTWIAADQLKETADGEFWQGAAANMLVAHGGAAMLALMLLGAFVPLHVWPGWRKGRNRVAGAAMVAFNAVLVLTAFGLYYVGSDLLRSWISNIHIGIGLCLPALFLVHVLTGRRGTKPGR